MIRLRTVRQDRLGRQGPQGRPAAGACDAHVGPELAAAYARSAGTQSAGTQSAGTQPAGTVGGTAGAPAGDAPSEAQCWSVERHVEHCTACAERVSAAVRATGAAPALARLREDVLARAAAERADPEPYSNGVAGTASSDPARSADPAPVRRLPGPGGRFARRRARIVWAAGPALRGPWLVSLVLLAAAVVCAARLTGNAAAQPLVLLAAPVLPPAGVALCYGRYADPLHEIAASTPAGGLRLLLVRTAAVLAVTVPMLALAGALLPAGSGMPGLVPVAAWLLPGLALTLGTLALGSFVGCRYAAAAIGSVWLLSVCSAARGLSARELAGALTHFLAGPAAQCGWAVAAATGAAVIVLRRTSYDFQESF